MNISAHHPQIAALRNVLFNVACLFAPIWTILVFYGIAVLPVPNFVTYLIEDILKLFLFYVIIYIIHDLYVCGNRFMQIFIILVLSIVLFRTYLLLVAGIEVIAIWLLFISGTTFLALRGVCREWAKVPEFVKALVFAFEVALLFHPGYLFISLQLFHAA